LTDSQSDPYDIPEADRKKLVEEGIQRCQGLIRKVAKRHLRYEPRSYCKVLVSVTFRDGLPFRFHSVVEAVENEAPSCRLQSDF
jgi:hypothetical protein